MTTAYKQRIERLRLAALTPKISYSEFYLAFITHFDQSECENNVLRVAEAWAHAFDAATPIIRDDELIVGQPPSAIDDSERARMDALYAKHKTAAYLNMGQDSHMAIDYPLLLECGVEGVIARVESRLASCADSEPEKRIFYESCLIVLRAVIRFSERYAALARQMADGEASAERREELLRISAICERVPRYGASGFYEAVQSVAFMTFCLSVSPQRPFSSQQFQLGHPDRWLYPYYLADKQSEALNDDFAQLLLDCLGIQINNRVPHGLSSGYMVGGRDRDGSLVQNELTIMGMQVIDDIRLLYPAVGFCYADGQDEKYLKKAVEIISRGRSHPAIFNDDLIYEGMRRYGVSESDSRDYIHSTCVEITPVAASNVWVASPYTNMLGLLLGSMDREYSSFDELMSQIYEKLDAKILANFNSENESRRKRCANAINPLLSCFVNDCIERGVDIEKGGARFNWIMPSFVGMANLVDSLYALKKLVFESGEFSIGQLKTAIDANFEGYEPLRLRLLEEVDKYGNDIDEVDTLYDEITRHISTECERYTPILPNSRLIPSVFCWIMHERFGRDTGASPDGRLRGFPLGDGSGPCQGREKNGPTASIISTTKWSHKDFIGGVALNLKFSKKLMTDATPDIIASLVKVYMERGGLEVQINVTDRETLLAAQKNPENYRDLLVRIGGYSDYFVKITPEMQAEVILRTEHEL